MNVWVNGCFDILHVGHIELFSFAKADGNTVFVGIDSDDRVKKLKGYKRPINSQKDRFYMLSALRYVDNVFIFNTDEELEKYIKAMDIDIMIVGEQYKNKEVIGSKYAKKIIFYKNIVYRNRSSSLLINKIIKTYES